MQKVHFLPRRYSAIADIFVLLVLATVIYGVLTFAEKWTMSYHPVTDIDLSIKSLPIYALLSALRALLAYFLSLTFTLIVGYWAAKSRAAEKIIIPVLDILQSIPVLGFLPGLVLGLVAMFPSTNIGLELAAVIMIFTGQVWNMTFSFYSSLKSIPTDLTEASHVLGMDWKRRLVHLELPFSAVNLSWNSLMSMAGGWFFLSVCEAFTLGDKEFRLPGLGAYMAVAIDAGNKQAMLMGIAAMVVVIVGMDVLIWRPVLAWTHRFRLEDVPGVTAEEPLISLMIRESNIYRFLRAWLPWLGGIITNLFRFMKLPLLSRWTADFPRLGLGSTSGLVPPKLLMHFGRVLGFIVIAFMVTKLFALLKVFSGVKVEVWLTVAVDAFWTFLRVLVTLILGSLWAVPVGIWLGTSPRRVRIAQPIIQVLASFPAPMLYPLALAIFLKVNLNFEIGAMFLMMLGVQWYILFNVLAGAMRIPVELMHITSLLEMRPLKRWRTLYLPAVFPALVTGWITAAGGAWNASIVAEVVSYGGQTLSARGLGATISKAASEANFSLLAVSLTVMVFVVVLLNRTFWARVYRISQNRFRMDL
ncbi:MAG: ABC transporter permease subunit [Bdellovibrionaceae bacterium]|nr:ABC transporter permease subunit [Pseudobdellovibrionaceae bacterium]